MGEFSATISDRHLHSSCCTIDGNQNASSFFVSPRLTEGLRIAWPDPRFSVTGDCVIDNLTGLMWAKNVNLAGQLLWQEAISYANGLTLCGYSDWRLPNIKESLSLIDRSAYSPALPNGHPFTNVLSTAYLWSSTTVIPITQNAWTLYMAQGYDLNSWPGNIKASNIRYVWPVRSVQ
ncbi:MAG: DUF1566 domain-containing protein [Nitrospirae bacterium]|nr:DUF1566 domain-containing protein [Nitrospirota bacterium]